MRNIGTMGLILNVPLFDGMQFKLTGERTIIFGAVDPTRKAVITYAIKVCFLVDDHKYAPCLIDENIAHSYIYVYICIYICAV